MDKDIHKGHRERVKEEFRRMGLDHFPDHKILEMLLYFAHRQKDTNVIGHRLLERFGSLASVFDAPYELLLEVSGVGEKSATLIKLVSAITKAYMEDCVSARSTITDSSDAVEYMKYRFLSEPRECVYMACMGNNGKVLFCNRIADGTPDTVEVAATDIMKMALRANAVKAVIAHNHPYGICNPSRQDVRATHAIFEELWRVGVELIDHIIVASDGVYSMKKNNMFPAPRHP